MTSAGIGLRTYLEQSRQAGGVVLLVLVLVGFVLASFIIRSGRVLRLDARLTQRLQRLRGARLDRAMRLLTILGDPPALGVVGGAAALLLWLSQRHAAGFLTAVSLLGLPLNYGIKELIRRPRPDLALVNVLLPVTGRSFPSGHAMTATMLYGFLGLLAWVHIPAAAPRLAAALLCGLLPLGIGLSRVYLGVHWCSDVVGGWIAGLFFLLILFLAYGWLAVR